MSIANKEVLEGLRNKAVELWHDLNEENMSYDEYMEVKDFIIGLFLEDK